VFSIPVDQDLDIVNYSILVDDEMINKYIEDTRKRFGKPVFPEPAVEETPGENTGEIKPAEPKEPVVEPAEMTPEFFNRVYPGLDLQTEEDFREEVRKDASMSFAVETDKLLFDNITEALVKNTEMPLPDEFLKCWLLENNEGKYTPEEIEKNYVSFADSMKWQLIENKLIKDHGIEVTDSDIRNYISTNMLRQANLAGLDPEMQKRYESIIDTFMQNKEQVQRINDQLYNGKLMEYFKSNIIFHPKEISYDEYVSLVAATHQHEHEHEHEHDHEHDHDHDHEHDNEQDHTH